MGDEIGPRFSSERIAADMKIFMIDRKPTLPDDGVP